MFIEIRNLDPKCVKFDVQSICDWLTCDTIKLLEINLRQMANCFSRIIKNRKTKQKYFKEWENKSISGLWNRAMFNCFETCEMNRHLLKVIAFRFNVLLLCLCLILNHVFLTFNASLCCTILIIRSSKASLQRGCFFFVSYLKNLPF